MRRYGTIILLLLLGAARLPFLHAQPVESWTFTTNRLVPDGVAAGLSDVRNVNSTISAIASLQVRLKITGEFNGDLYAYLRHSSGFVVLLNRPGKTAADTNGYTDDGFDVTFQNGAANGDVHLYQNIGPPTAGFPLTGIWQPDGRTNDPADVTDSLSRTTSLSSFNGVPAAGEWTLYIADVDSGGANLLTEWGLDIVGAAYPTLTWEVPPDIVYGTALDTSQLNASAIFNSTNVPGIFTYTPAAGTMPNAGSNQLLQVTFTPADMADFLAVSTNVAINVQKAPVALNVASSANPSDPGQSVVFTATATATGATPDGSVVFCDGSTVLATTGLSGGQATLTNSTLGVGTHFIAVHYAGSANFLGVTNTLTQDVSDPPPLASVMTVTRTAGLALLIAWSDVATNWSDPNNSPVSLAGINLVTTNHVTLATNSAWILYPKAPNVNDQFSYSIRDGFGATNIGFVNVVIKNSVTGTNSITKIVPGNPTILTAYGIPGYSYITERSTNLAPLVWVDIATNTAAANGLITVPDYFSDLGSNAPASAYYQLKWQP